MLTIASSGIAPAINPPEYLVFVTQALLERRPVASRAAVSESPL